MPVPLLPDVSSMGAAARDIRAHADQLRRQRAALVARSRSVAWHSRAAVQFQHSAENTLARMDACAHALEQAAATLDRHASAVHARVAEIVAIPAAVEHAGAGLVHGVSSGLSRATHWVGLG